MPHLPFRPINRRKEERHHTGHGRVPHSKGNQTPKRKRQAERAAASPRRNPVADSDAWQN